MFRNHEKFNNVTVAVALIVAGIWAVFEFQITTKSSIVIETKCVAYLLDDTRTFLRVYATISNVGNADQRYRDDAELYITVRDIQPSYNYVPDSIIGHIDFADAAQYEIFDLIGKGTESLSHYPVIMPKGKQPYQFTFLVAPWVSNV